MKQSIIIIFICISLFAKAQWYNTNGPYGGNINPVIKCKNILFTNTATNVYKSTDNGITWVNITDGLNVKGGARFFNLIIADSVSIVIQALNGHFKWNFNTNSWDLLFNGYGDLHENFLFISNYQYSISSYSLSLFNGITSKVCINNFSVFNMTYYNDTIYALTVNGIYKSKLGDTNFVKIKTNLTTVLRGHDMHVLNNRFFLTTSDAFYVSDDACKTWNEITYHSQSLALGIYVYNNHFVFSNNNKITGTSSLYIYDVDKNKFDSLFKNNSFISSLIPVEKNYLVTFNNSSSGGVYYLFYNDYNKICGNNGIFMLDSNFKQIDFNYSGFSNFGINSFFELNAHLMACSFNGLLALQNPFKWNLFGSLYLRENITSCLANDNSLIASTTNNGIFISKDNGNTWSLKSQFNGQVYFLYKYNTKIFAGTQFGLYYSSDKGETWNQVTDFTSDILSMTADNNYLYLNTLSKIYISQDGGTSWTPLNSSISSQIQTLYATNNKVFAGTLNGLYMTSNSGVSWFKVNGNDGLDNTKSILCFTSKGNNLYLGTNSSEIYEYNIQTQSCRLINSGTDFGSVTALYVKDTLLFAATEKQGIVYLPINNPTKLFIYNQPQNQGHSAGDNAVFSVGASGPNITYQWQANAGLGFTNISDLGPFSGSASNSLHIQNIPLSLNNTLFRCMVYNSSDTLFSDNALLTVFATGINDLSPAKKINVYPNPTSRECFIENVHPDATWELYDCQGNNVGVNCTLQQQTLSLSALKPGLYFLTILQNNTRYSFKVIREE